MTKNIYERPSLTFRSFVSKEDMAQTLSDWLSQEGALDATWNDAGMQTYEMSSLMGYEGGNITL